MNRLLQLLSEEMNTDELYNENNSELVDCYVTGSIAFFLKLIRIMPNKTNIIPLDC